MKTLKLLGKILFVRLILLGSQVTLGQNATEIIKKADEKWNGEKSSESYMVMTIVRPTWERTIEFKNWTKGKDNSYK